MQGSTLKQLSELASPQRPEFVADSKRVLSVLRDASVGIAALHHQEYIHRDIHAGNVMVRTTGGAVVIDLGHARKLNDDGKRYRPEEGGDDEDRPLMMAPATPDSDWTKQTDVWQFGQMAREIILGVSSGNSYAEARELKEEIPLPEAGSDGVRCELPANVKQMLRGCLDLEPSKRPAIDEVVKVLTEAVNDCERIAIDV